MKIVLTVKDGDEDAAREWISDGLERTIPYWDETEAFTCTAAELTE
jgi:hypothetical protein